MNFSSELLEFREYRNRLAQFKRWDNQARDWEAYWSGQNPDAIIRSHLNGNLGELEIITSKKD